MTTQDPVRQLAAHNPVPDKDLVVDHEVRRRIWHELELAAPSREREHRVHRTTYRRVGLAAAATAAVSVTALSLTASDDQQGFPGAVRALADEIGRPGAVLHTITAGDGVRAADGSASERRSEVWESLDGSVTRRLTTLPNGDFEDLRVERRAGSYQVTVYRSKNNELSRAPALPLKALPQEAADDLTVQTVMNYAEAVDAGRARVDGDQQLNGASVYRVVDTTDSPLGGTVYFVTKDQQRPALRRVQPSCNTTTCPAIDYSTFEISPDSADLELPSYPNAEPPPSTP